jgi:hypothetical protein
MTTPADVRAAFAEQAAWCVQLGSPLTAQVCRLTSLHIDDSTTVGRKVLGWTGTPGGKQDALALRLAGGLNALARQGHAIAAFYPPNAAAADDIFWPAIAGALAHQEAHFLNYLHSAPQTNEVMRSAALMLGFLFVARQFPLPLHFYEIGSSGGLNLFADQFRYTWGSVTWGNPASAVQLVPDFDGDIGDLANCPLEVRTRQGVDVNPVDIGSPATRAQLLSYIWPDQPERIARLEGALAIALAHPPALAKADAADWVEAILPTTPDAGGVRVLFHSIVWQYLPETSRHRIMRHMEKLGDAATPQSPLAWVRFEQESGGDIQPSLRVRLWPDGSDHLLARAHPHASTIKWLA